MASLGRNFSGAVDSAYIRTDIQHSLIQKS